MGWVEYHRLRRSLPCPLTNPQVQEFPNFPRHAGSLFLVLVPSGRNLMVSVHNQVLMIVELTDLRYRLISKLSGLL